MSVEDVVAKILPKVNWPVALVITAGLALYGFVLAAEHVTPDDLRAHTEDIKETMNEQGTTDAVHGNTIDTIYTMLGEIKADIRELRDK
jgi:hypothetical protein